MRRRKTAIFFLIIGICLSALAVALQVGWILLNLREAVLLVIGIIFFGLIITGLILNTVFLFREIRRNEQHDTFLNAVTHELKTPIASIKLDLETVKTRDVEEEKRREFYDVMLADSNRLLNTVEQVLKAGSLSAASSAKRTVLNIDDAVNEAIHITRVRHHLDESAIRFVSGGEGLLVNGDPDELQTVFVNLLDNAVKYRGDGPVKISVKTQTGGLNNRIGVVIKDKGVGIETSDLKRIFSRFYRAESSKSQAKGTGLGLFIVKSIVERHGGRVKADSKGVGRGSTFLVQLPKI